MDLLSYDVICHIFSYVPEYGIYVDRHLDHTARNSTCSYLVDLRRYILLSDFKTSGRIDAKIMLADHIINWFYKNKQFDTKQCSRKSVVPVEISDDDDDNESLYEQPKIISLSDAEPVSDDDDDISEDDNRSTAVLSSNNKSVSKHTDISDDESSFDEPSDDDHSSDERLSYNRSTAVLSSNNKSVSKHTDISDDESSFDQQSKFVSYLDIRSIPDYDTIMPQKNKKWIPPYNKYDDKNITEIYVDRSFIKITSNKTRGKTKPVFSLKHSTYSLYSRTFGSTINLSDYTSLIAWYLVTGLTDNAIHMPKIKFIITRNHRYTYGRKML